MYLFITPSFISNIWYLFIPCRIHVCSECSFLGKFMLNYVAYLKVKIASEIIVLVPTIQPLFLFKELWLKIFGTA